MAASSSSRKVLIVLTPIALLFAIAQWSIGERGSDEPEDVDLSSERIVTEPQETREQPTLVQEEPGANSQQTHSTSEAPSDPQQRGSASSAESDSDNWDGGPQTTAAMDLPDMKLMAAGDSKYDATTEARQLFHTFEMDLLAADPLNPANYRTLLGRHKSGNAAALKRVMDLRAEGREKAATELYDEWSRLFEMYRKRAYSRTPSK